MLLHTCMVGPPLGLQVALEHDDTSATASAINTAGAMLHRLPGLCSDAYLLYMLIRSVPLLGHLHAVTAFRSTAAGPQPATGHTHWCK